MSFREGGKMLSYLDSRLHVAQKSILEMQLNLRRNVLEWNVRGCLQIIFLLKITFLCFDNFVVKKWLFIKFITGHTGRCFTSLCRWLDFAAFLSKGKDRVFRILITQDSLRCERDESQIWSLKDISCSLLWYMKNTPSVSNAGTYVTSLLVENA